MQHVADVSDLNATLDLQTHLQHFVVDGQHEDADGRDDDGGPVGIADLLEHVDHNLEKRQQSVGIHQRKGNKDCLKMVT